MGTIFFVATTFISWERNLFPGHEFYFVAPTFVLWERLLFRWNEIYFVATTFISSQQIKKIYLKLMAATVQTGEQQDKTR